MAVSDNASVYTSTTGLGVPATYNGSTAVEVIFEKPDGDALEVAGTRPRAYGAAAVFPVAAIGKTLLVNGTTYTIRDRRPMDDGLFVELELQE